MRIENPLELPNDVARVVLEFVADVIDFAHKTWPTKWGLTDYQPDVRINVGFTEVLTTSEYKFRLISVLTLVPDASLGSRATIEPGKAGSSYYPSIADSVCVEVPYSPLDSLPSTLTQLRPALFESIRRSGRRGLGRGVRAGHSPDLVREIGRYVGRTLPQPDYVAQDASAAGRVADRGELLEGALMRVMSNRYERNPRARGECVAYYGTKCQVCDFSFGVAFGALGEGFIHVHHASPVSRSSGEYVIDPIRDLCPVCPNCHAMLHVQDPPLTVDELRRIRARSGGTN